MSWENMGDTVYRSKCACGKGYVENICTTYGDDWNRFDSKETYQIHCKFCKLAYHLEKGYLVPNGLTLKYETQNKLLRLPFDEWVVSRYSVDTIRKIINDMTVNKFYTRLTLQESKYTVDNYGKRKYKEIIPILENCIEHYDDYFWHKEDVEKYEKLQNETNRFIYETHNKICEQSYLLHFIPYKK